MSYFQPTPDISDRSPLTRVSGLTWREWTHVRDNCESPRAFLLGLQHISNIACGRDLNGKVYGQDLIHDLSKQWNAHKPRGVQHQATLARLNYFLFDEMGFIGNILNYHHPDNACIDKVIENRRGSPMTLSAVYMLLARDAGLKAGGCEIPGHYCVRVEDSPGSIIIDPFNRGRLLSLSDAVAHAQECLGSEVTEKDIPKQLGSTRRLLVRVCLGLSQTFSAANNTEAVLNLTAFQLALYPSHAPFYYTLGKLSASLGLVPEARAALHTFLRFKPTLQEREVVEDLLGRLGRV